MPPGDPDAIADALERLAVDDRLVDQLRERQRRRGATIGLANVAGELVRIYEHVTGSAPTIDLSVAL